MTTSIQNLRHFLSFVTVSCVKKKNMGQYICFGDKVCELIIQTEDRNAFTFIKVSNGEFGLIPINK